MKTAELKKKKIAELVKLVREKHEELREFRFGVGGSTNTTSKAASLRKDIARIKTELTARSQAS